MKIIVLIIASILIIAVVVTLWKAARDINRKLNSMDR